jgi:PKD repeat protein
MKKLYLLLLSIFLFTGAQAQNCNFSYSPAGATNVFIFTPNPFFPQNIYHFTWDFGDGTTSTLASPTHAYNSAGPWIVCYNILDSSNNIVCTACDSLSTHVAPNCSFTYTQGTGLSATFQSSNTSILNLVSWTFDGGITYVNGNTVTNTFPSAGIYNVCMTVVEVATGDTCVSCQPVTISGHQGGNCSFNASVSPSSAYTYNFAANAAPGSVVTWSFGDGTSGSGWQATHAYNAPGGYVVCMTAVDSSGTTCNYCDSILVGNSHGNCHFTFAPAGSNGTFLFTGTLTSPNNTISWDFGDGSTGSGNSITHSYSSSGIYTVCMNELDSNGTVVCTFCNTIAVGQTNACAFVWNLDSLNPTQLTANFHLNGGFGSTITWDFGDNTTATGPNVSHTYTAAGTYTVCVTVATPGALNCTYCSLVTVGNPTGACIVSYFPDSNVTNGYVFNVQTASAGTFIVWDFGDGTVGTGNSVNHVYASSGVYTVCVIERDSMQNVICYSCVTIQVGSGGPGNCNASFHATSLGLTAHFIDMSVVNTPLVTYHWDFGDGSTSSVRFPQHTYTSRGTYNVCLTIVSGNCTDIFCSTLFVDTAVTNPLNCQAFFTKVQLAPFQVTVVNLSSGVNLNFHWDFGDGSVDSVPYPSHQYTNLGSYVLCLTVSDANGCTSTYCDTLSVDSLGNVYRSLQGFVINVVSPATLTGVNEIAKGKLFKAYPNPVTSELYFNVIDGAQKADRYRILSIQGSEILSGQLNGVDGSINVQSLITGNYLFEITLSDGTRSYQKIIKE